MSEKIQIRYFYLKLSELIEAYITNYIYQSDTNKSGDKYQDIEINIAR